MLRIGASEIRKIHTQRLHRRTVCFRSQNPKTIICKYSLFFSVFLKYFYRLFLKIFRTHYTFISSLITELISFALFTVIK